MNVDEIARTTLDAWNRGDVEAFIATLDPEIVYHTSGLFPGLQPEYVGHDGMREFWRAMHEPWETLRAELDQITQIDESRVVVDFRFRGIGAESGAAVDLSFSNAGRLRDGLVLELFAARSHDEALQRLT